MADTFLNDIQNIKRQAATYNDASNQPDTFRDDPMMNAFLMDLQGFNQGASDKPPKASRYAGGNAANEKLMQAILDRLLNNQYYQGSPNPSGTLDPSGGTHGETHGGSPWQKFMGLFS